jgi:phosphoribosyl-ATP pyrophosphohydrolase/phosphoribosyl-AMP cyclohydrolase/histidinol dehydrogenase
MSQNLLRRVRAQSLEAIRREPLDPQTLLEADRIVEDVRAGGEPRLRAWSEKLDGLTPNAPLLIDRAGLKAALDRLPRDQRGVLERAAARITRFADAQRACLQTLTSPIPGGQAGHTIEPIERVGCYAPGGRFPLPSSALMTAIPARVAGSREIWMASPNPALATLAAAALAGADGVLCAGGAQAIAAMACGIGGVSACDIVVGPGNRWVTAAKYLVSRHTAIDMLAGPSELVVLADESAEPRVIAADLLAQAEHDPDARAMLVTTSAKLANEVDRELREQLLSLPTAAVASESLARGGVCVEARDIEEALRACDSLAPEHLQVITRDAAAVSARVRHAGAVFIGASSAEALGDYGAGPNHTLPTGAGARSHAGLSVFTFLRARTWLRIDDVSQALELVADAAALGRLEGLEAHARSAEARLAPARA